MNISVFIGLTNKLLEFNITKLIYCAYATVQIINDCLIHLIVIIILISYIRGDFRIHCLENAVMRIINKGLRS
jgi:hypothetical protein